MPLSKKAVIELEAIARKLERMRHKEHFNMNAFVQKSECGTAHCIAGMILVRNSYRAERLDPDVNDNDYWLLRSPEGQTIDPESTAQKAGLVGGPARAKALSPERRREIAQLAAKARWGKGRTKRTI